jgi:hypothetical protein
MPTSRDQDHFDMQPRSMQESGRSSTNEDNRVAIAAHRLAIYFTDEANLPVRFRKSPSSAQPRKIETMLAKISNRLAWRLIKLSPEMYPTVWKVTDCKDFCDFVDYLILRRDTEKCGADELGGLALLSTAFQREIEKRIQPLQAGKTPEPAGSGGAQQRA